MGRLLTLLAVALDALPFAAGAGAATFLGASNGMRAGRAAPIAAAVALALFAFLGLASWVKYRAAEKRFWLLRRTVHALAFSVP